MGIFDEAIAIADEVTKDLGVQPTVTHQAWTGQDSKGRATYAAAVSRRAVVDLTRKQRTTASGVLITIIATVTILEPVAPNGAAGRREPIDPRDIITLPDGTTGPIVDAPDMVVDAATNRPLMNTVMLAEVR